MRTGASGPVAVTGRVNSWLAEKADPPPSQTILDVAAGTGDLGFIAAERVAEVGRVISTDFAPEMVDVARRQGESRGLSIVEYRELDAERMELEDDSVDGVVCRWGYMLMADPAAALEGDATGAARRRPARLRRLELALHAIPTRRCPG